MIKTMEFALTGVAIVAVTGFVTVSALNALGRAVAYHTGQMSGAEWMACANGDADYCADERFNRREDCEAFNARTPYGHEAVCIKG